LPQIIKSQLEYIFNFDFQGVSIIKRKIIIHRVNDLQTQEKGGCLCVAALVRTRHPEYGLKHKIFVLNFRKLHKSCANILLYAQNIQLLVYIEIMMHNYCAYNAEQAQDYLIFVQIINR
jgi:hypothetical protein